MLRQFFEGREFNHLQIRFDAMLALFRLHLSPKMIDNDIFCKIVIDYVSFSVDNLPELNEVYGCTRSRTASSSGRTLGSPSRVSTARQAFTALSGCAKSSRGERQRAALSPDARDSGNAFRQRPPTDGVETTLSGRPIRGAGNRNSDWSAQPRDLEPPHPRSVPNA